MASNSETVYQITASLRRYKHKQTQVKEIRIFKANTREETLAALKEYAKNHNYRNYRILHEGMCHFLNSESIHLSAQHNND
jgi:hypothetical protein